MLSIALPALAQFTRDKAASEKIDEAINQHYLATEFDKAEGILLGTVKACEDKCKPSTLAKAWMYVGIVRGSGRQDLGGAKDAFSTALSIDPNVKLDAALATDEVKQAFAEAGGTAKVVTPEPTPEPTEAPADVTVTGSMQCEPAVTEVQTRRPVPMQCTTAEDATSVELHYKDFGAETWNKVTMRREGDAWTGTIPCDATRTAGTLRFYVRAKDANGDTVDNYGTKNEPVEVGVVPETAAEPPAIPGQPAPERCVEEVECPPDFPGCGPEKDSDAICGDKDWGASCENSTECACGLLCQDGVCETAPSCDVDADCDVGSCVSGKCQITGEGGGAAGPYKKHWVGLHFGYDLAVVGGKEVCSFTSQSNNGFSCFLAENQVAGPGVAGDEYLTEPYPGTGIASGIVPSTFRILLSYDFGITPNITIGARGGVALNGGPNSFHNGNFQMIHAELRGAYWFGQNALGRVGLRPYIHLGGGLAMVDAKVQATVGDCSAYSNQQNPMGPVVDPINLDTEQESEPPQEYWDCAGIDPNSGNLLIPGVARDNVPDVLLDVYRRYGPIFVGGGGGLVYAFKANMGVQLNLNAMILIGTGDAGFNLEPTLGFVYGL